MYWGKIIFKREALFHVVPLISSPSVMAWV